MSPTAIFYSWDTRAGGPALLLGGQGVPGVVRDWGGPGGAIPGTYPVLSQGPYLVIFQGLRPTHGQMKAISDIFMRFLRYDPDMTPQI